MAKTNAIEVLKQRASAEPSKEAALLALSAGRAAMSWQAVVRTGD